jgi:hypothetical protein
MKRDSFQEKRAEIRNLDKRINQKLRKLQLSEARSRFNLLSETQRKNLGIAFYDKRRQLKYDWRFLTTNQKQKVIKKIVKSVPLK